MADAFISYSHDDREFAERLKRAIHDTGRDIWVDESDIPPGARWADDILTAIEDADNFLFIISPDSAASGECLKEISHAASLNKRIIPVVFRVTDLDRLPPAVRARQFIPGRGVFEDDSVPGNTFTHSLDVLIKAIDEDLDAGREHTRWGKKALEWDRHDRDRGYLLYGSSIAEAERWLATRPARGPEPSDLQRALVLKSRQEATRRQRRLLTGVSVALVLAIVLAVLALVQRNHAVSEEHVAQADALAADAINLVPIDTPLAIRASLQAYDIAPTPQAAQALSVSAESPLTAILRTDGSAITKVAYGPPGSQEVAIGDASGAIAVWSIAGRPRLVVTHHTVRGAVTALSFNDRSALLAVGNRRGQLVVWNQQTHKTVALQLPGPVASVAFDAGGNELVVGEGSSVTIWATDTWTVQTTLPADGPVTSVAFNPAGTEVAFGTSDDQDQAELWDPATNPRPVPLNQGSTVTSVSFSPGDPILATGDLQGYVTFWSTVTDTMVQPPLAAGSTVGSVAFSDDGTVLASGTTSGDIILWNLQNLQSIEKISPALPDGNPVTDLAFSPTGNDLLTGDTGGNGALWDLGDMPLPDPTATKDSVRSVAFSPNGRQIAMSNETGVVILYNQAGGIVSRRLPAGATGSHSLAYSPDGRSLVDGDDSAYLYSWPIATDGSLAERARQLGHKAPSAVYAVAFSSDGRLFADGDAGNSVRLWQWGRTVNPPYLNAFVKGGAVRSIVFSPDGRLLVAAGDAGTIAVFDTNPFKRVRSFSAGSSKINSLAISPDGRTLAAGDDAGDIRLWDLANDRQLTAPLRDRSPVITVAFSRDGSTLVSGDSAGDIVAWNPSSALQVGTPIDVGSTVDGLAFSPGGDELVAGDDLGSVRLFQAAFITDGATALATQLCRTIGDGVSKAEWSDQLPHIPYQPVCQ